MIKLTRPTTVPNILLTKGKKKCLSHCISFNRLSVKYINGDNKFKFDSDIYGDSSVKTALKIAQSGKCCFCESKVTHISYGDIEHFRPKAAFNNNKGDKLIRPGYYWLVYDWTNLLFSCQLCNQRYKKNLFPLLNPRSRAKSPKDNISKEKPVFINPYEENPKRHIGYRQELPYGKTKRGEETIKALGLDRNDINEMRLSEFKYLEAINSLLKVAESLGDTSSPNVLEAKKLLKISNSPNKQYSSMIEEAIKNDFQIV